MRQAAKRYNVAAMAAAAFGARRESVTNAATLPGTTPRTTGMSAAAPIALTVAHAETLLKQFQETARIRGW